MRIREFAFLLLLTAPVVAMAGGYAPKDGYVPDERTAVRIAIAVLEPIYGVQKIAAEHPFHGALSNGVWTVTGSLPEGNVGGVAQARIAKRDGKVIGVSHGQ